MASINPETAWEFADAIKSVLKIPTTRRRATVQSVEKDGTIWVQLPGSSTTTPIASTGANVAPGDTVLTELRGTSLHITENNSDPAVGTRQAGDIARQAAKPAVDAAKAAQEIADEAQAVANATNQHFWDDDNGAHVTDVTKDEWIDAAADDFSDLSDAKPYHNLLMNSLGILLRRALNNLVSISKSAIAFYDGMGNASSNIVARFGSDGAQIGESSKTHIAIDTNAMSVLTGAGSSQKKLIAGLSNDPATGLTTVKLTGLLDTTTVVDEVHYFALNHSGVIPSTFTSLTIDGTSIEPFTLTYDAYSVLIDKNTYDSYRYKPVEVVYETASPVPVLFFGSASGEYTIGANSVAFGRDSQAPGIESLACGRSATASGEISIALGKNVQAGGYSSVAIGNGSKTGAGALAAFAAGFSAKANGHTSIALGSGVVASCAQETVIGKFNDYTNDQVSRPNTLGQYALVIGNGTADNARSNALAVRWNGLTDVAGETAYPLFVYSTAPDEADLPVTPCFVLSTSDYTLLYYDGQNVNTVPGSKLVMQSGNTKVYASGKVVTVAYDATIAHKNTWTYLTDVIPAEYRPPTTLYNIGFDTGNRVARTLVNSGGQIGGYATVDNARVYGLITYMVM